MVVVPVPKRSQLGNKRYKSAIISIINTSLWNEYCEGKMSIKALIEYLPFTLLFLSFRSRYKRRSWDKLRNIRKENQSEIIIWRHFALNISLRVCECSIFTYWEGAKRLIFISYKNNISLFRQWVQLFYQTIDSLLVKLLRLFTAQQLVLTQLVNWIQTLFFYRFL